MLWLYPSCGDWLAAMGVAPRLTREASPPRAPLVPGGANTRSARHTGLATLGPPLVCCATRPIAAGEAPVSAAPVSTALEPGEMLAPLLRAGLSGEIPDSALTAQIAAQAERVAVLSPAEVYSLLTPAFCGHHPHV